MDTLQAAEAQRECVAALASDTGPGRGMNLAPLRVEHAHGRRRLADSRCSTYFRQKKACIWPQEVTMCAYSR